MRSDLRGGAVAPVARALEHAPDWRRYLTAALRYRWWVLAITGLGTFGGAAMARFLPPGYLAQTTIWIQSDPQRASDRGPIGSNQLLAASAWLDLLKSYVVLDDVVRELRLYLRVDPADVPAFAEFAVDEQFHPGRYRLRIDKTGQTFRLEGEKGVELDKGGVGDSLGRELGFRWVPPAAALTPGHVLAFTITPLRDAAKGLGEDLRVSIDPSGNFLRLALSSPSGTRAAEIVNAVAVRYVAVAVQLKRAKLTELARLLNEQFHAAEASLRQAERALQSFRERTITLPPDPAAAALGSAPAASAANEFYQLKIEQDQLGRDREVLRHTLARLRDDAGSVEALASIGAVQKSPDLAKALQELTAKRADLRVLQYRYTDDHPSLRLVATQIDVLERRTIPVLAQGLLNDLVARERVLGSQVDAGGRQLRGIPQRAIEEARLRRDVSIAEHLYTSVQQRYSEAQLAEASSIADVRILDNAVAPQRPVRDRSPHFIALGLVLGLGLGLVGAVLVDRFDPRVRYPDQVTHDIGLPILGVLPHLKDRKAGPRDEHVIQLMEAMRSLRLNLAHAYGSAGPLIATVTSPGIGDGKSFVAANLALAYAESGEPTLLIDGDTRRGALHRTLQAKRKPGLTDFLAGRAPLEDVTQATMCPNLHVIGAGTRFRDSPELLASADMVALLARLRATYRVILVDSPPLGAGVDPYTLSTVTGSVLLVLRTGSTNLDLTQTKLAMMDHLPVRQLGVVLNDVDPAGVYRYYSYLSGYGPTDEGEGFALDRRRLQGAL